MDAAKSHGSPDTMRKGKISVEFHPTIARIARDSADFCKPYLVPTVEDFTLLDFAE